MRREKRKKKGAIRVVADFVEAFKLKSSDRLNTLKQPRVWTLKIKEKD